MIAQNRTRYGGHLLLAEGGARVALLARRTGRPAALAAELTAVGGQALAVTAAGTGQASVDASVDAAAKAVHDAYGRVDLVVNNAGPSRPGCR